MPEERSSAHGEERPNARPAISWLIAVLRVLVLALFGLTLTACLGAGHQVLELFSHFRVQYAGCALLGAAALLLLRDRRGALLAFVALGVNAWHVLPWYFGRPQPAPAQGATLKIFFSNVYTGNLESRRLLDVIASENPDIVVLEEIDRRWVGELSDLFHNYPASKAVPRSDNFGIGMWARLPATITEITLPGDVVPSLSAQMDWRGNEIALLAAHPVPPVQSAMFRLRNAQLGAIANWARAATHPCVVIGDLNVSLWSPYHARLVQESGLQNARQGFGVLPTWPTHTRMMMIPLDHCLVSPNVGVHQIRVGPHIGSDHLPLIVELRLPLLFQSFRPSRNMRWFSVTE